MSSLNLAHSNFAKEGHALQDDDDDDDDYQLSFSLRGSSLASASTFMGPPALVEKAVRMPENKVLDESTFDVILKLSDLQGDPKSPLHSFKEFGDLGLSDELIRGIYFMGFRRPSKIQEKAIPLLLADPPQNMIAQSQSGTGKTAAFVLNILSRINTTLKKPQALVLAPTRELARQIMGVIQTMGQFTGAKTQFAIPGLVIRNSVMGAQIIVGTPGTTMDCISKRILSVKNIKVFVVDEADTMLDRQGLGDQCLRVKSAMPKDAQILLWSATFPKSVVAYAERFAPGAHTLSLQHHELTVIGIKQMYMDCASEADKFRVLTELYGVLTIGSSIIFVRRRIIADEICKRMIAQGHKVAVLHGQLGEGGLERDKVIDEFRFGKAKVLITTNVLARGIDVATVSMVVNYDLPTAEGFVPDPQTYLHRIGRTGRFGRVGVSISFVHDHKSWEDLCSIADYFNVPMMRVPADDIEEVERVVKKVLKAGPPKAGDTMEVSRHGGLPASHREPHH